MRRMVCSDYDARVIVDQGPAFVDYFEEVSSLSGDGKQAANWMTQDVLREMHERNVGNPTISHSRRRCWPTCSSAINKKQITIKSAREGIHGTAQRKSDAPACFRRATSTRSSPRRAWQSSPTPANFDAGDRATSSARTQKQLPISSRASRPPSARLIGQVMKLVKGADPQTVRSMLVEKLSQS